MAQSTVPITMQAHPSLVPFNLVTKIRNIELFRFAGKKVYKPRSGRKFCYPVKKNNDTKMVIFPHFRFCKRLFMALV